MRRSATSKLAKQEVCLLTSERQRDANRLNAKSSTGPRSAAGKVRAAKNALRHGLNVPILSDPALAPEAEAIAQRIAASNEDADVLERARRIGEAQVDLRRARARRRGLLVELLERGPLLPLDEVKLAAIFEDRALELARLDRYERRALSRRKSAIRSFDSRPASLVEPRPEV